MSQEEYERMSRSSQDPEVEKAVKEAEKYIDDTVKKTRSFPSDGLRIELVGQIFELSKSQRWKVLEALYGMYKPHWRLVHTDPLGQAITLYD